MSITRIISNVTSGVKVALFWVVIYRSYCANGMMSSNNSGNKALTKNYPNWPPDRLTAGSFHQSDIIMDWRELKFNEHVKVVGPETPRTDSHCEEGTSFQRKRPPSCSPVTSPYTVRKNFVGRSPSAFCRGSHQGLQWIADVWRLRFSRGRAS